MIINIKKRDGVLEEWNYDKVLTSIEKAMIPLQKAEQVANSVEKWIKESSAKGQVTSTQVRDKIIELLAEVDPVASENYKVYKKP